jgi:hypothetical protein
MRRARSAKTALSSRAWVVWCRMLLESRKLVMMATTSPASGRPQRSVSFFQSHGLE